MQPVTHPFMQAANASRSELAHPARTTSTQSPIPKLSSCPSSFPSLLRVPLQFQVSNCMSQAPNRFACLERSPASRKGEISGRKQGDFQSIEGGNGEKKGRSQGRKGGNLFPGHAPQPKHKHRPSQHLNFLPRFSSIAYKFFHARCTPIRPSPERPSLRPQQLRGSVDCPALGKSQRVERWSVSSRLLVGHRSVTGRFKTTSRHPRLIPIIAQTSTCKKQPEQKRHPTQLRTQNSVVFQVSSLQFPVSSTRHPTKLRAFSRPLSTQHSVLSTLSKQGRFRVKNGRFYVGSGSFEGHFRVGSMSLWGRFFRQQKTSR